MAFVLFWPKSVASYHAVFHDQFWSFKKYSTWFRNTWSKALTTSKSKLDKRDKILKANKVR